MDQVAGIHPNVYKHMYETMAWLFPDVKPEVHGKTMLYRNVFTEGDWVKITSRHCTELARSGFVCAMSNGAKANRIALLPVLLDLFQDYIKIERKAGAKPGRTRVCKAVVSLKKKIKIEEAAQDARDALVRATRA